MLRRIVNLLVATSVAVCTIFIASEAVGAEVASELKPGVALLEAGNFQDAYAAFEALFEADPGDAQVNFYLGLAALGLEDYEAASLAFERTLMVEPDMERARLELARTYMKLGLPQTAKSYFEEVLRNKPPANVENNIRHIVERIDAASQRHFFSGVLMLGLNYDTNVGASPESSTIQTPALGTPFVTVGDEEDDFFGSLLLRLQHRFRSERPGLGWRTQGIVYGAGFAEEYAENLEYVRLATGPSFERSRTLVDVMAVGEYLGKGSEDYMKAFGCQIDAAQALWGQHFLMVQMLAMTKEFDQAPDRDAWSIGFSAGPVFRWGANKISARIGFEMEDASDGEAGVEEDELSFDQYTASLRYERELPCRITLYAGYRYRYVNYDSTYAAFAEKRDDDIHDMSAGMRKVLTDRFSVDLSHTYTDSDSSIELYEYKRHLTSLNVLWSF